MATTNSNAVRPALAVAACALPLAWSSPAMAHPGHAPHGAPALHAWTHALPVLAVAAALGLGIWWVLRVRAGRQASTVNVRRDR